MNRLVFVAPLRPGMRATARSLLAEGPPFDLASTRFDRHEVYLTEEEVVFVFEAAGEVATLEVAAEDPAVWRAARAWHDVLDGRPRVATVEFTWNRAPAG